MDETTVARAIEPKLLRALDLTMLEQVFLVHRVPAWHTNRVKQITKAPKLLIADSARVAAAYADRRRR